MSEVGGWSDRFTGAVEIGRGAFGVVYRAREVALGREVAVKVLSTMVEGSALERFEREGLAMSALSGHPNVVPIYSTGVTEAGRPFLVMPYLSKGSLRAKVTTGPLPWADVARIGVRLAGALEYAHEAGVLHRDVKPDNVLISDFDEPLLADFGIARLAGGFETVSRSVTASIVYAAPEVLDGQTPTIAADVYSLGASLFHLLAGKPAFAGSDDEGLAAVYVRISRAPVPDLAEFGVPAPIAAVISTAMAKDPAARPVSAERFGRALQNAQRAAGVPMTAMVLSTPVERVGDDRVHNSVPAAAAPAHHPTGAAYGGGDPMNPDSPLSTVEGKTGSTLRRRSSGQQRSDRRRSPIVLTVVVALALAGVAVAVLVHRSSGTGSSASSTTSASTAVDTPLVLTDQPVNLPLHIAAGMSAQMPISATAGERVFGTVTLSAKPATPIPIALMFNDSPAESNTITDRNIDIDPVTLDSTGT